MDKNTLTQLINELTEDDLTKSQKYIANEIGMENFINISLKTGGGIYCFPNCKNLFMQVIKRHVREEFDGSNYKELAAKYEISYSTVYSVVKEKISRR